MQLVKKIAHESGIQLDGFGCPVVDKVSDLEPMVKRTVLEVLAFIENNGLKGKALPVKVREYFGIL